MFIRGDNIQIDKGGSKRLNSTSAGSLELYYDNSKKLETIGTGVTVIGDVYATRFYGDGSNLTNVSNYTNSDVDTHLNTGTASNNEVLSWNGSDYNWVAISTNSYQNSDVDTHLNTSSASTGEVLSWNGSDYDWVAQSGGGNVAGIDTTGVSEFNHIKASGIVTATRFESTTAGTPSIDSPNNLDINAVTVSISTDLSVGNKLSVGIITSGNIESTGIVTAVTYHTNDTVGDGSDVGFAIKYSVTANGASSYRFSGPGLVNSTDNPSFYLQRGFSYIFVNTTGSGHPFRIQFTGTTTGVGTYVSGSQSGTQIFTVPFDAPSSYEYQCTLQVV